MESERRTDGFRTLEARALDPEELQRDALTGLHGRAWFEAKLAQRLSEGRELRKPLTVILADIDRLGAINQAHGEPAGDRAIRIVSTFLRGRVRYRDLVARQSGGAFAILLPHAPASTGTVVAERLRAGVADEAHPVVEQEASGRAARVTVSVGCVTLERSGLVTHHQLMEAAARALAAAKRDGRDRVVCHVGVAVGAGPGDPLDRSGPAV